MTITERLTLTRPWPKAGATWTKTLADKLKILGVAEPSLLNDVEAIVDHVINTTNERRPAAKGRRVPLIARLRAVHACKNTKEPGFVAMQTTGERRWMCDGCRAEISLPSRESWQKKGRA